MSAAPLRYAVLLTVAAGAAPLAAGVSGTEILRRAAGASERLTYRGQRHTGLWIGRCEERVVSREFADGKGRFRVEYLAPAASKGRIQVDDGKQRWQQEPHSREILRGASSPLETADRLDLRLLARNYHIRLDPGKHRVARRPVYRLSLASRRPGKPRRILWIDRHTYLVLRRETVRPDGSRIHRTAFSRITFNPKLSPGLFRLPASRASRVVADDAVEQRLSPGEAAQFIGLPSPFPRHLRGLGFELYAALCSEAQRKRSVQLVYEDGLTTLSVFVDSNAQGVALAGSRPVSLDGGTGLLKEGGYFSVLRWSDDGFRYTLVGDLAPDALRRVAGELAAGLHAGALHKRVRPSAIPLHTRLGRVEAGV